MKRRFKMLSIICTIIMVMSCVTNNIFWGSEDYVKKVSAMDYEDELELGKLCTVELHHKFEETRLQFFKFVPPDDGTYIFYSLSDSATAAHLYNADRTVLLASDTDRKGRNENFSLECELQADLTYCFGAQYADSASMSGSFLVGIRKAASEAELNAAKKLAVEADGLDYEISAKGDFVYAQFSPVADGYYNIYSRNACGQLGVCDGDCGCETPCSCLSTIYMQVYEKDDNGELKTLYLADAGSEGGVLLRNYFEKSKTYYVEMSASDCQKTGKFKLYVDTKLVDAPVEQLKPGTTIETNINGTQESLVYKIVPEKTANYRFLSNKRSYLYMSLYNNELEEVAKTSMDSDGFDEVVELEAGQTYYFVVNANYINATSVELSVEEENPKEEDPKEDPKEEDPKEETPKEEDPKEETPSGGDTSSEGDGSTENNVQTTGNSTGDGSSVEDLHGTGNDFIGLVSLDKVDITPIKNQKYTGKKLFPTVKVSYQGVPLKVNEDYTAVYKSNKNIGVGSITLTGRGSFSGTQKISFKIVPAKVVISKGKRTGSKLSLKWKKVKGADGYEITYAYSANFKKAKKMTVKNCEETLKLTSAKKCYVKVRAYKKVKGKKYFGEMSKKKKY